jgi:hypothetical protein
MGLTSFILDDLGVPPFQDISRNPRWGWVRRNMTLTWHPGLASSDSGVWEICAVPVRFLKGSCGIFCALQTWWMVCSISKHIKII